MNPDLLQQYIAKPSTLNKKSLFVLNELTEQFPYCQTVQILFVKNLHNLNHFQYSSRLKLGAAYATDRKVLHDLINSINHEEEEVLVNTLEAVNDTPITSVSPEETAKEIIESIITKIAAEQKIEPPILTAAEIVEARLAEINKAHHIENLLVTESEKETIAIIPAVDYKIDEPIIAEPLIKEKIVVEEKKEVEQEEIDDEVVEEVKTADKNEFHSFSEWLKNKKESATTVVEEKKTEEKTLINSQPKPVIQKNESKPYQDLIERFIETEPRIQPTKGTFYSPVNMARQSAVDNDDIISETLAKIYYQQGNLQKALNMYEKLSLKYPEKIIFFAAQIETIKKSL
jgi:tetratricopeptide (TPR) repeat protein